MRPEEGLHVPGRAVPDVAGLKPSLGLLEVAAEGLAHFLPTGRHTLGSLNLASSTATGDRTW